MSKKRDIADGDVFRAKHENARYPVRRVVGMHDDYVAYSVGDRTLYCKRRQFVRATAPKKANNNK